MNNMEAIKKTIGIEMKDCMQRNITDVTPSVVYNASENKESYLHCPKNVHFGNSDVHIIEGVMDVVMRIFKPRT